MAVVAAGSGSFADLRIEHFLQRRHVMPARKLEKTFVARHAMREITLEHALDGAWRIARLHVAVDLVAETGVRPEAAADMDVIALDRIGVLADIDLAGEQADIADVMLRAGMMAAGEMNIDRAVEFDACLAILGDLLGVALSIGGREAAADIAGAGHQPSADRGRFG